MHFANCFLMNVNNKAWKAWTSIADIFQTNNDGLALARLIPPLWVSSRFIGIASNSVMATKMLPFKKCGQNTWKSFQGKISISSSALHNNSISELQIPGSSSAYFQSPMKISRTCSHLDRRNRGLRCPPPNVHATEQWMYFQYWGRDRLDLSSSYC
jgi:hypothetical protein